MKYLTPELLAAYRSDDDVVAAAVAAQWDTACLAYRKHLKAIQSLLPKKAQWLSRRYLHDAQVLTMAADRRPVFSIFLQLEGARVLGPTIELKYQLAGAGCKFIPPQQKVDDGKPLQWWLYDEFDVTEGKEGLPIVTHSILFTGGWEVRLCFKDLHIIRLRAVVSPSSATEDIERIAASCS